MKKHKNIVLFLLKFFATYFVLFVIYSTYLQQTQKKEDFFACSPLTTNVAKQTVGVLKFFGYNAGYVQHEEEMSVKLLLNDTYVARVIEGCNSISIIILFVAFIIAFSGKIKPTLIYVLIGSVLIYIVNIFRIAFLTVMLEAYPKEQTFLHNIVFPAIIYGFTFLLWVIWVNKFSKYRR